MSKKKGYRSYLNDFKLNSEGKYAYEGALYGYYGEKNIKKLKWEILLLSFLPALCAVLSGCIPSPGMDNCFYVIIPWVLEIASSFSLVWASVKFMSAKVPLRGYIYNATLGAFSKRSIFNFITCASETVATVVFVCINGFDGKILFAVIFFALKILSGILGNFLANFAKKADFRQDRATKNEIK